MESVPEYSETMSMFHIAARDQYVLCFMYCVERSRDQEHDNLSVIKRVLPQGDE